MTTNIEGTPEQQRAFNAVCPDVAGRDVYMCTPPVEASKRQEATSEEPYRREIAELMNDITARHIMQQIIAENLRDPDLDWIVFQTAAEIEEENGLPEGVTADDVYQEYLRMYEGE